MRRPSGSEWNVAVVNRVESLLREPVKGQLNTATALDGLWLSLAAGVLYLWRLGMVPLRDWDEGTVAFVARAMVKSGDWIYPTLYGGPYLNKPPLVEWLMATGYIGSISEWTSRFLPALISALAVPLLYWLGREAFGARRPALLSALVFLTLLPVVRHGRLAMRDGVAVTLFLLALLWGLKTRKQPKYALGVGIALGLIALTKGILVLLLGTVALVFLWINQGHSLWRNPYLWLGFLLGSMPVVAWYGAQVTRYGDTYWQGHFVAQSFERVTSAIEDHQQPPWYYVLELVKYSWPWVMFWPVGLGLAWRQRNQPWGQLVLVGTAIYLGAISLMGTKLPWYIMPLYPFVALAIGGYLHHVWQRPPRWAVVLFGVIAIAALIGGTYLGIADQQPTLIAIAIALGFSTGWAAWQLWRQRPRWCLTLAIGLYGTLLLLMGSDFWLWELNEAYAVKPVAALVNEHVPTDAEVVTTFSYGRPSLNFYCDRYIAPLTGQPLLDRWQESPYVLAEAHHLATLPAHRQIGQVEGMVLIKAIPE